MACFVSSFVCKVALCGFSWFNNCEGGFVWFSQQCMGASFPYSLKMSGLNQKASEELVERIQSEWFMQPYAGS